MYFTVLFKSPPRSKLFYFNALFVTVWTLTTVLQYKQALRYMRRLLGVWHQTPREQTASYASQLLSRYLHLRSTA